MNASWNPATLNPRLNGTIDVSIAVDTGKGLITPIVRNADNLGLSEISAKVRDLATRAKENKLALEEFQGGTFTVSNLGMFGIQEFKAVINPPQSAILAVGAGVKEIIPLDEGKVGVSTKMVVTLSHDRRVVDEALASLFLSTFNHYVADPELLLL